MSKAEVIDGLLESAISAFSKRGYSGASLREIAALAGVPLSTIHMYFGSKSQLYEAVEQKVWAEIDQERSALLHEALVGSAGKRCDLERLIHALALPIIQRSRGESKREMARLRIMRSPISPREATGHGRLLQVADRSMARWIDAMAIACPMLTRQDLVWAFSFCVGTIYSWQLIDGRYDRLLGDDAGRTVDELTYDIVAFCNAGVRSLIDRRASTLGAG